MHLIHLLISLGLLWLHIAAANLLLSRCLPFPWAITRALAILLPVLVLFFFEHFCGLGRLQWLWPISASLALMILWAWREEWQSSSWREAELAFALCFGWALLWKILMPALLPTGERVTDLYFMANYAAGDTLPPPDHWFAGYRFNFYYSFQHYGGALLARWFDWDLGFAYNIAFALVLGLGLALAWHVVRSFLPSSEQALSRYLLIAALALGGTGVSPFAPLLVVPGPEVRPGAAEEMWASARFIGNYDAQVNTELGRAWFSPPDPLPEPNFRPRELPLENFGYQFYVRDYHPPLGGFLLLFLMLALMQTMYLTARPNQVEGQQTEPDVGRERIAHALLALCGPLMLITNTWVLPMLAILLLAWLVWRYWQKQSLHWPALLIGGALGMVLIYPFLNNFIGQSLNTPIRLVAEIDRTPLAGFLLVMWPLLILFILNILEAQRNQFALWAALTFLLMMLAGEFLFVDDPSAAHFERTNTTMKWWGWMWSAALLTCGALALTSSNVWRIRVAQLVLLLLCSYAVNTARVLWYADHTYAGRLSGKEWLTEDVAVKNTIDYLALAEKGIVLENWLGHSNTIQTLYALYSGQPSLLGWVHHVSLWRNSQPSVLQLNEEIRAFYLDRNTQALPWLLKNKVRYIVWGRPEEASSHWPQIDAAISSHYAWREFTAAGSGKVGVWERREQVFIAPE